MVVVASYGSVSGLSGEDLVEKVVDPPRRLASNRRLLNLRAATAPLRLLKLRAATPPLERRDNEEINSLWLGLRGCRTRQT